MRSLDGDGTARSVSRRRGDQSIRIETAESKQIFALLDRLPQPAAQEFAKVAATANGAISVRLPRSVHAALLAEAKAEGVSLNQLCLTKLATQLRAVVESS